MRNVIEKTHTILKWGLAASVATQLMVVGMGAILGIVAPVRCGCCGGRNQRQARQCWRCGLRLGGRNG